MPFSIPFEPQEIPRDVVLYVREADARDAEEWTRMWQPILHRHAAEDAGWDWHRQIARAHASEGYACFALESDKRVEGLMSLSLAHSRLVPHESIVYVEYLGVAPWNQSRLQEPEERGIGTLLVEAALRISIALGFKGRIGLHSKPSAEAFYRKNGLLEIGVERTDDGEWMYFEATPELARKKLV